MLGQNQANDASSFVDLIKSLVEKELGSDVLAIYLYGSQARGDATPDSDWDILVMLSDRVDWLEARSKLRSLSGKLAEENNELVSFFPLRSMDAPDHAGLLSNVVREGRRL